MNLKYICGIIGGIILMFAAAGCKENGNDVLTPFPQDLKLNISYYGDTNGTLNFGASQSSREVTVNSNSRWIVEISGCEGGWCSVPTPKGTGSGSFTINVQDNMYETRYCFVTVYIVNAIGEKVLEGSRQIKVEQTVSKVRLSPSYLSPFAPSDNGRFNMEIIADGDWTLDVTYEGDNPSKFVSIYPDDNYVMKSNSDGSYYGKGSTTFYLLLSNNWSGINRNAFINLKGEISTSTVEVIQLKQKAVFDVYPTENIVVPAEGGTINFDILSYSHWSLDRNVFWIKFSEYSGEANEEIVSITATIDPNPSGALREGNVYFNSSNSNCENVVVKITQRGVEELAKPAVSIPWLVDGYGSTFATVEFTFYSPFKKIVEAGLQWRKASDSNWNTKKTIPDNGIDCKVSFELTNLEPSTQYIVRGFVKDEDDNVTYGSESYAFTTPSN